MSWTLGSTLGVKTIGYEPTKWHKQPTLMISECQFLMGFLSKPPIESILVGFDSSSSNFDAVLTHRDQISSKNPLGVAQSTYKDAQFQISAKSAA